jgi:AcrR family transcriptional regulator
VTETAPVVTRRPLRSDSAATRQRVIDGAIEVARREPLSEITMRDIARAAGVSTATAYTYFASKEHVYAEAYVAGVRVLTESVRARPPSGATAPERVAALLRRAVRGAAATGDVVQATAISLASSDPSVASLRPMVDEAFEEWIDVALAGAHIADRREVVKLLQLTMFASFVAVAHGRLTLPESARLLDLAVQRLVVERA